MSEEAPSNDIPAWIVTFSDMATLLLAFFVLIVTYASRDPQQLRKLLTSISGGKQGNGAAGPKRTQADPTQILVRPSLPQGQPRDRGSQIAPLYSDPAINPQNAVSKSIEESQDTLLDGYEVRLSRQFLFGGSTSLTADGTQLLMDTARQMRRLPYDIQIKVGQAENVPLAAAIFELLFARGNISHTRLGIAVTPTGEPKADTISLVFVRKT